MNVSTAAVKHTAKTALKKDYYKAIIVSALYIFAIYVCLLCNSIIASIAGVAAAFIFLICAIVMLIIPLTLGFVYFAVRLIFGSDTQPVLLFKYFSGKNEYIRALRFALPLTGNAVYSGFLLFLPAFVCDAIANGTVFKIFGADIPLWASSIWSVSAILKVFAGFCFIIVMLKFYLAPFLLTADENMDPLEALHMSKVISSVSKRDFIWLILSLAGYILACAFVVPNIFIYPYFIACYCVHCRFAVAAFNKNIDKINQKDIPSFEVI